MLRNKLLSQGVIWGIPVQPIGQMNLNTAETLREEISGLALASLDMWLVQVAVEGRSCSMSSQPDATYIPLCAPLRCPCLMGVDWEGRSIQVLCFRHRKYWMVWEQLGAAIQKFCQTAADAARGCSFCKEVVSLCLMCCCRRSAPPAPQQQI